MGRRESKGERGSTASSKIAVAAIPAAAVAGAATATVAAVTATCYLPRRIMASSRMT